MLNTTVQFTVFPRPPILLSALLWTLRADLPSPWNAEPHTKGRVSSSLISAMQGGHTMCLAGHVPAHAPHQDICFLATLSIRIQLAICRRIQIFLCHLRRLSLFRAAYHLTQAVVRGCTAGRTQTSWIQGKWLLDHDTESPWKLWLLQPPLLPRSWALCSHETALQA